MQKSLRVAALAALLGGALVVPSATIAAIDDRHVEMCRAKTLDYLGRVRDAATDLERFRLEFPQQANEYRARRRALDRSIDLTAEAFAARQKLAMLVVMRAIRGDERMTIERARQILGCVLG